MEQIMSTVNRLGSVQPPGTYVNPKTMDMRFTPFTTTDGDFYSNEQIDGDGMYSNSRPMVSSRPFIDTNGFIQYTHSMTNWSDKSQLYIVSGMLLFAQNFKQVDGLPLVPDMALSTLNVMLYQSWLRLKKDERDGDADAIDFYAAIKQENIEERILSFYNKKKKGKSLNNGDDEALWKLVNDSKFANLTRFKILQTYNYVGVAMTDGTATGLDEITRLQQESKITNVNICFAKRCKVANIWGDSQTVRPGTKLFLVLTKDPQGYYKIVPKASFDDARLGVQGDHVWHIGYVKFPIGRYGPTSAIKTVIRSNNPQSVYNAVGRLEAIEVNLGF